MSAGVILAGVVFGGAATAQDLSAAEALGRTVAQVCHIGNEVEIVLLRRDGAGHLMGLGDWADWQVSEGEGRLALLKDGNVLQIGAGGSVAAIDGEVKPIACVDGSQELLEALASAGGMNADALLGALRETGRLASSVDVLSMRGDYLAGRNADLRQRLAASEAEQERQKAVIRAMSRQTAALRAQLDERQEQLADIEADPELASIDALRGRLATALVNQQTVEAEAERLRSESDQLSSRLAEALLREQEASEASEDSERRVAALNAQVAELRNQVNTLQALLDVAQEADEEAQAEIEMLGLQLNTALARIAAEVRRRELLEERGALEGDSE